MQRILWAVTECAQKKLGPVHSGSVYRSAILLERRIIVNRNVLKLFCYNSILTYGSNVTIVGFPRKYGSFQLLPELLRSFSDSLSSLAFEYCLL